MRSTFMRLNTFFSVAVMLLVLVPGAVRAQQTVTCGTGTSTGYYSPFCNFYNNSWHEMIFQPSELGGAAGCSITKIAFQCATSSYSMSLAQLDIYMGTRTTVSHDNTTDWTGAGALDLVYSHSSVTIGGTSGWQTFTLDVPYSYDGQNPLVVVVAKKSPSGSYTSSLTWYYSTVTGSEYPGLYRQNDSDQSYGTHPGSNTGTRYSSRANTRFTYSSCCSVARTGTFEFRNASGNVVTSAFYVTGNQFNAPTLVNTLTPAGTPTYSSSNPSVVEVNANTGELTFHDVEGTAVITAYVAASGSTCPKSTSYTITSSDGCVKVGTGTYTLSSHPVYGTYKNSYVQMIYTAAEVGTPGLINSIGFNAASSNSVARTIDIYMGETTSTAFSGTNAWIPESELQLVYSGTWNIASGWNMFQLDQPFTYSGAGNIVVAVDASATSTESTSFYYTSTSGTSVLYAYSDTYDAIPSTITSYSGSKYTTSSRANIKFCIDPCEINPENFGFSNSMAMCYLGGQPTVTLERDGNNSALQWSSSDPSVAEVDENGVFTTHALGTTTISVFAPIDGDVCSARDTFELQVICPANIPSAQSVWICDAQAVDLTVTVRDDEGNLELRWFDDVLSETPIYTGDTYHTSPTTTTTYYVAAYNTDQQCYSSRVPATVHIFDVQYDATTTNISGYVGVPMYGYAPEGSHEGATFEADNNMPAWLTLNSSDGSFSGTPTAAGSGQFIITVTNSAGCSIQRTIYWTVTANDLGCCDFEAFYIYQDNKPFPLHLADDGYYYADVCLNSPMSLRVQKLNNCSGTYTYFWRLSSSTGALIEETSTSSATYTYTYNRTAGYGLTLTVKRNGSNCITIPIRVRVAGVFQVATRPSFNLCHGEPFNIYVSTDGVGAIDVVRPEGGAASTLGVSDTILLPDGEPCNGNCFYRSSVTFADFAADAVVRNPNDILYVLLNIEHTFIGDIYIAITCPDGRRSVILSQCGSGSATCHAQIPAGYDSWVSGVGSSNHGSNFGEPNSGNSTSCDPNASGNELGIGWNYIWSENTTRGYVYAGGTGLIYDDANVNNYTVDSSDIAHMTQIYRPQETFNNLVNCPLNGTWSIEVVDGWSGDNGHIFNWELGLNEELIPGSWSYSVDLDSSWVHCGWNSNKSGVYMEITPPDDFNGTDGCDLYLRDEYGCVSLYQDIVTITMNETVHSETVVDGNQCEPYTWARNNQTYTASGTYVDAALTPAGCPDTATLRLTVAGAVYETIERQACNSFYWDATEQTYTSSGSYEARKQTVMGCDSIITLNLTISSSTTVTKDTSICPDNFPLNNWYDWGNFTAAGTDEQHFTTAGGCDSLVVLTVQAYPKPDVTLPAPEGAGGCPRTSGSYIITPTINNAQAPYTYNWSGDYMGTSSSTATIPATATCGSFNEQLILTDANGCKDTATLTFNAVDDDPPYFQNNLPDYSEVPAEVMGQDCRFRIPDIAALLNPADNCGIMETVQNPPLLDDIVQNTTVVVTVTDRCGRIAEKPIIVTVPAALTANELDHTNESCDGMANGTVTLTGVAGGSPQYTYSWTSTGAGATDVSSQTGTTLTNLAPGTYTVTITDAAECSIEKSVAVGTDGHPSTGVATIDVCDEYTWHGNTYTQSNNTATFDTINAVGCDSTTTLNLTIRHSNSAIFTDEACETYTWHENTYTQSTDTPTYTCANAAGCDSVTTLHLTVYHSVYQGDSLTVCDTYTWVIRGHSYTRTQSDNIVDVYTIGTCTGADTLYLTINHSSTGCDDKEACDQYPWPHNGQVYNQSISCSSPSAPRVVLPNGNMYGCDSTVVLNLNIKQSTHGYDVHNECDSYLWPMNSTTYYSSTTQPSVYAGLNAAGCDSTVHLNLTVRHSTSSVVAVTACDSYPWSANGQTYTASTNATDTITNRAGCDSVINLHLTINYTRYGTETDTVCTGDRFTYHGQSYPVGNHNVTLTASNNCDSIVALQVVARPQLSVSIDEYHSCELAHYEVTGTVNADANLRWSATPADPDLDYQRTRNVISVNPSRPTDYTLTAGYGQTLLCPASATIHLTPLLLPISDLVFNPPFLTCDNLSWTATSASSNAQQLTWYVDDIEVSTDNAISGTASCHDDSIRVSLLTVNGICTNVLDTVLYIRKSEIWFPNAFTPNLNINKTFAGIGRGIVEFELYIYTREGLLVFHSNNLEEGWRGDHNGVECPRAAYTYIARYRNEVEPNVWHKVIGTVMLLR